MFKPGTRGISDKPHAESVTRKNALRRAGRCICISLAATALLIAPRSHAQLLGGPPIFNNHPNSQTVTMGDNVTFSAGTVLSLTLCTFTWKFENVTVPNTSFANASTLALLNGTSFTINNVQPWQAGLYFVAATNGVGYAISSNALLTVTIPPGSIVCWGSNRQGQIVTPSGLTGALGIAAGGKHSVAIKRDKKVSAWGDNTSDQTKLPPGADKMVALSAGSLHTLALKEDGKVLAWGDDTYKQDKVPGKTDHKIAVAAGGRHSLALDEDSTVMAWGDNSSGQTNIPSGLSNVVAIAAGDSHNLALKWDGSVVAWGTNTYGQCSVPTNLANVIAIAAGDFHSLALLANGTVTGWGDDSKGQISGFTGLNNVVQIAAGGRRSLALLADGNVIEFGGTVAIPPGVSNVVAISAGGSHNMALTGDGTPVITVQPFNRAVAVGGEVTFNVCAVGQANLSYQWRFKGTNILGATGPDFTLTDARTNNVGDYNVVVSNSTGSVTSSVARLTVTLPRATCLQPLDSNLGAACMRVIGPSGACVIQVSTDLVNWSPLTTTNVSASGILDITDNSGGGVRFYRAYRP